jgi:SAM-dependent methyltransferase
VKDHYSGDYVQRNRNYWDRKSAEFAPLLRNAWSHTNPSWGIYSVPEAELKMLPDNLAGMEVVDLGCGTGYVCAWMQRLGAHPTGIDNSPEQIAIARDLQKEYDLEFPILLGNAEETLFEDESFDFAISEYGASIWCDPYRWIPEAARILKPGGLLHFLVNGTILMLCSATDSDESDPVGETLERPLFGMHRIEWTGYEEVEFHLPPGKMISLLHQCGFEVLDLIEVEIPEGSTTDYDFAPYDWARKWPVEEVWKARKRG